tara:strand:- start:74 stop:691 length:618 start_codon:yes stop_codon:yes gene_type:complete
MIGYGSLMNSESRKRTNPEAKYVFPVLVNGFKRLWGIGSDEYGITFLTIVKSKGSIFNGAYYKTDYNNIIATDNREQGYCRIKVDKDKIKPLGLDKIPKGDYWVYAQKNTEKIILPSKKRPIVQSYVDIFLNGCIEIGDQFQLPGFLSKCIETTHMWLNPNEINSWINDRIHPQRPFDNPNAFKIDKILHKKFKNYYKHIKTIKN